MRGSAGRGLASLYGEAKIPKTNDILHRERRLNAATASLGSAASQVTAFACGRSLVTMHGRGAGRKDHTLLRDEQLNESLLGNTETGEQPEESASILRLLALAKHEVLVRLSHPPSPYAGNMPSFEEV